MHREWDNMTVEELKTALADLPDSARALQLLTMVLEDFANMQGHQVPPKRPRRYRLKDLVNSHRRNTHGGHRP